MVASVAVPREESIVVRILVTGSQGQLGGALMASLEGSHHDALGVDIGDCDLTDRDAVLGLITTWRPEVVLHCAAFTAVDRCETEPDTAYRANALATRFVVDGARRVGAHGVYISTDYVFDGTKMGPYVEWDTPNPQSVYGRSKLGGEREVDPSWAIARTSWVVSDRGSNMARTIARLAAEPGELAFVDDQFGCPTFAGDLAAMVLRLGVERVSGIHHVTNAGAVTWYEFAQAVLEALGDDPQRVRRISTADLTPPRPAPRPANSVLDNFTLRHSGLGELRDFREALAEVAGRLRD